MQHVHDVARTHLHNSAKRQEQTCDTKVKANQYDVGDLVWSETVVGQLNIAPKLRVPYKGLYMIWKQLGALDYELHMDQGKTKMCIITG